jgi:hypothetical protein
MGATGPVGPVGAAGAPGTAGDSQYAYVFNLGLETVTQYDGVLFSSNGDMSSGFAHVPGTAGLVVSNAGVYEISFSVNAAGANQIAVGRNGGFQDAGANFGSSPDGQTTGTIILSLAAGDVLSLQSESRGDLVLNAFAGGSLYDSDATLAVHKIG